MSAQPSREPDPAEEPGTARPPDDVPVADVQGMFAFYLQPRLEPPDPPGSEPHDDDHLPPPVPLDPAARKLERWVRRFAQMAAEVVGGDRPASQLVRWTTKDVAAELGYRATLTARSGAYDPGAGHNQPLRPRIRRPHIHPLSPGVVEANVTVQFGEGCRALALRFERRGADWICTVLNFGRYD